MFVSSSFVSRSATCKHWILDHLSYYSIVKNITRFSTRQVDIRLSFMLWHVLTSHCEDRLCVPVTHTHIKSHISSQAFKWGDNISAYYSRMSFQEVKVILLLTNSEQYMVKSIPREIYFFPKAAKYIQRKIDILLISTIQEISNNSRETLKAFKAESKPGPAWERRWQICFGFVCDGQHRGSKAHTNWRAQREGLASLGSLNCPVKSTSKNKKNEHLNLTCQWMRSTPVQGQGWRCLASVVRTLSLQPGSQEQQKRAGIAATPTMPVQALEERHTYFYPTAEWPYELQISS